MKLIGQELIGVLLQNSFLWFLTMNIEAVNFFKLFYNPHRKRIFCRIKSFWTFVQKALVWITFATYCHKNPFICHDILFSLNMKTFLALFIKIKQLDCNPSIKQKQLKLHIITLVIGQVNFQIPNFVWKLIKLS